MLAFIDGCVSHTGLVREINEDAFLVRSDLGLWAVADGMGGHNAGDVASQLALDCIDGLVASGCSLTEAVIRAHERIIEQSHEIASIMGTTVVALRVVDREFEVVWAGDSRAYLCHDRRITRVTHDHSYVQRLIDNGQLAEAAAQHHPMRSVLTLALVGSEPKGLRPSHVDGIVEVGDCWVLCSDGLTEHVTDYEILMAVQSCRGCDELCGALVNLALERGGTDNITVVAVSCASVPK